MWLCCKRMVGVAAKMPLDVNVVRVALRSSRDRIGGAKANKVMIVLGDRSRGSLWRERSPYRYCSGCRSSMCTVMLELHGRWKGGLVANQRWWVGNLCARQLPRSQFIPRNIQDRMAWRFHSADGMKSAAVDCALVWQPRRRSRC